MGGGEAMVVIAGLGCRRNCGAASIIALVRAAAAHAGRTVTRLAAPDFKTDEPGLREAAYTLGLPLVPVTRDALEAVQARCQTHSARAARAAGVSSVAEASALAEAGPLGRLVLPRIAAGGATCALAEAPFP